LRNLLPGLFLVFVTGCATVSYSPPKGVDGSPLNLTVSPFPRSLSLGSSTLRLEKSFDEHGVLPFLEDGGSYTAHTGGHYVFQGSDGAAAKVTIVRDSEINVNPGGRWLATLSTLNVQVANDQGEFPPSRVTVLLGSDSYLVVNADKPVVVSLDYHGISEGKPVTLWNQPTAFVFKQGGRVLGYLSLVQEPVFYQSKGIDAGSADLNLAVLVAYECFKGRFEPGPVELPNRTN